MTDVIVNKISKSFEEQAKPSPEGWWGKERVEHWFGNRGVFEIEVNKFEVRFPWLFIREDNEVASYYLDSIYCEAQDCWPAKDFDWSDDNVVKLCKELSDETKYYEFGMGLLAISGDCGGGMSDHHDFIILNGDHFDKVKLMLRFQLEAQLLIPPQEEKYLETYAKIRDARGYDQQELIDLGIFGHKWHNRSTWILVEMHEGKPSTDLGLKLNFLKQGEHL
jgi:hypothetical protein